MVAATNFALLHGGGQGSWLWDDVIGQLSSEADCIALDVPGCGEKRERDTSAIEFDDIARELNSDIVAAGMRDVVLVGHSQAGTPIPRMVEFAPTLFSRLEVGYPLDPAMTSFQERFAVMFCNDMSAPEREAFLAKLGHDDWPASSYTSLPSSLEERFAETLRVDRVVRIDAGHQVMNTRPQALAATLLAGVQNTEEDQRCRV